MTVTQEELDTLKTLSFNDLVHELYLFAQGKHYTTPNDNYLEAIRDEIISKHDEITLKYNLAR